ncbi:hypothetical protein [Rickettsiella endosymbiont of Miltochrista miniata]|uniref:hypothetical protein n=1 Tax=Rickettsiella endosymbiont of Miltochrista miniata TaxID=3066239 RepID=UPI00313CDE06
MLRNNDVVSIQENLTTRNYDQLLSNLRQIGLPIKQAWLNSPLSDDVEKYKFTSNPAFKEFLVAKITHSNIPETVNIEDIPQHINQLKNQLSVLAIFLTAWKENPRYFHNTESKSEPLNNFSETEEDPKPSQEPETEQLTLSESEKKILHQLIKFKADLDKDDRHAIHIALQTITFILCQQSNNFIKHQEKSLEIYAKDRAFTDKDIENKILDVIDNKQTPLNFIFDHIESLNNFESDRYGKTTNTVLSLDQNELYHEIEKIGRAISSLLTPNKKKKLLKYAGILLAFIASLACGLTTGGFIFLMGPSLLTFSIFLVILTFVVGLTFNRSFIGIAISLACGLTMGGIAFSLGLLLTPGLGLLLSAIYLGVLAGLYGFKANFGFFSKNFPDFLLSLVKKGGINEYIDIHGSRKQFSATYKYLLTPLIIFASLTVGAGATAITYITISSLLIKLTTLLPILAILWPPLPLIIAIVLAVMVAIVLTVSQMTASLKILKKVAALNKGFKELCQYAYENCITWFKNFWNLDGHEKAGVLLMLLLLPVGLLGLAYFRYTAGADLSPFIGLIGAIVTGVVAYLAQVPFTFSSINKLKNAIVRPSSAAANDFPALTVNAAANGALVLDGSPVSIAGMIACTLNSYSGNMSETDMNQHNRNLATAALAKKVASFNTRTKADASASTYDFDLDKTQQPLKFSLNTNSGSYPQEPNTVNPPSPTGSENELLTKKTSNNGNGYAHGSAHFFQTAAAIPTAKPNYENGLVANR